ncbi:MAG: TRAP transporter large permease subunit [Deltaproteobacteria bacterium]|nr:TRAP transporter large permease subunit [Deltaproteobacteria bacterium]MBW2103624.1 TRAP transporter large permease subunit [Deltaproteobacteria bacterium]
MVALPFIVLLVGLLMGLPIAFSLGGAGIVGMYLVTGNWNMVLSSISLVPFGTVAQYTLSTIPMFILMAYFSASSGLARDLYKAGSDWLSNIRGGLAIATVGACAVFGAMSGAAVAAASVMSTIALPEMKRHGYSDELAAGTVGIGSTIVVLVPPSVGMIIYGIATQTSIGKLLIAGVVPGLLVGALLTVAIFAWATIRPQDAPQPYRVPWSQRFDSVRRIWPSILVIVIVLVMLYTGMATPTEVGATGSFGAMIIGLILKRLDRKGFMEALAATIRTSAMIFNIIIGAEIFGNYMSMSQIPPKLITVVGAMNLNRWVVIAGIVITYFVISMFMDEIPLLLLTLQLTYPLVMHLGFDPIWYGVLSMMMMAMGMVFPPVGILAFVVSATAKMNLVKVYTGTSVLMIAIIIATILMMIFPQIALWLPSTMK